MERNKNEMNSNAEIFNNTRDELIKYPCPINRKIVDVDYCFDCVASQGCDIYATMLDE